MSGAAFAGAVLAGGRSRRIGIDKALIRITGTALVARAAQALAGAGAGDVAVVGGDRPAITDLGLAYVPDRWPGEGPLGGLVTALRSFAGRWDVVAVLSCDLVEPDADAVRRLVDALAAGADAAVPVVDGRSQWLHSVWRRRCVDPLEAAFVAGERAIHRAVGAAPLDVVTVTSIAARAVADADTVDELPPGADLGPGPG